jgi:antitoxin VapB
MNAMAGAVHTKVFWSGGSQAVRLPKDLRVEGTEVLVRRQGRGILIEPAPDDDWDDFWERLIPLREPVRRWKTKPAERRRPL